jgi:hypothetical protein
VPVLRPTCFGVSVPILTERAESKGSLMNTIFRRVVMILAAAVLLPCLVQTAKADTQAVFSCAIPFDACGGGPISSGSSFATTTAISNLETNIGGLTPFTFLFDTAAGTATLFDATDTLNGTISGGTTSASGGGSTNISFDVLWDLTNAANVAAFLGTAPGFDGLSQVFFSTGDGSVTSTTLAVSPVPEPATLTLFGTGLLVCGRLFRRKKQSTEAAN